MTASTTLLCGRFSLSLDRPLIMGVLNVTPDSFSDGGQYLQPAAAIERAQQMLDDGADILDIGGESTRPGAAPVSIQEEMDRVLPVLEALLPLHIPLSIDTRRTPVMQAALRIGVDLINDVSALEDAGALQAVAPSAAAVCLMHKQGEPDTMQQRPHYASVVDEVAAYLQQRVDCALAAGIRQERLLIDPGFGFGKTLEHNLALLAGLSRLGSLPILAGLSRKSMLGQITGQPVEQRVHASVAAALIAVHKGAAIVRVHDVSATRDALRVLAAVQQHEMGALAP